MKDFNIAKYLKENQLGSYGILNHYVDLKPVNEDTTPEEVAEVPYEGPDDKLTGNGDGDSFEQAETISEAPNRIDWEDLDDTDLAGSSMEMAIDDIIDDTQNRIEEYVASAGPGNPRQAKAQIRVLIKKLWLDKISQWKG